MQLLLLLQRKTEASKAGHNQVDVEYYLQRADVLSLVLILFSNAHLLTGNWELGGWARSQTEAIGGVPQHQENNREEVLYMNACVSHEEWSRKSLPKPSTKQFSLAICSTHWAPRQKDSWTQNWLPTHPSLLALVSLYGPQRVITTRARRMKATTVSWASRSKFSDLRAV